MTTKYSKRQAHSSGKTRAAIAPPAYSPPPLVGRGGWGTISGDVTSKRVEFVLSGRYLGVCACSGNDRYSGTMVSRGCGTASREQTESRMILLCSSDKEATLNGGA